MLRVIVAGGRDFSDYKVLTATLNGVLPHDKSGVEIVSGHAKGADSLGERYAEENQLLLHVMPADWKTYGKAAGVMRNRQMLEYAMQEEALVVAFWDGKSRGTKNMIDTARKSGVTVHLVHYSD